MPGPYEAMARAFASASIARSDWMVCPVDEVEWRGRNLECWACGGLGEPKFPPMKEEV